MRITVFTSNQPRHTALIEALAGVADAVHAVQECNTVFPGEVDDFFRRSVVMRDYFQRVIRAESDEFDRPRFAPDNVRQLPIRMGDLSRLPLEDFGEALDADVFLVFGASFIRGPLCDLLVDRRAINIHMGTSPYYRGSSTNFWALYDRRPQHVGATIHLLTHGLDSGPILFHALPAAEALDPFTLGMRAVRAAQDAVVEHIRRDSLSTCMPIDQDRSRQIRYTRNADFTDRLAKEYLDSLLTPRQIEAELIRRDLAAFVRPYVETSRVTGGEAVFAGAAQMVRA